MKKVLACAATLALLFAGCGVQRKTAAPPSANINNGGFVSQSGDALYFANFADDGRLYRRDAAGKDTKLSDDRCYALQPVGDWIYYKNRYDNRLYRLPLAGGSPQPLGNDPVFYPQVLGDWIYYLNSADDMRLYRVQTDGTLREKLCDDPSAYPNVTPEGIYYSNTAEGGMLYFVALDGTRRQPLLPRYCANLNIVNGWAYFIDMTADGTIFRWNLKKQGEPVPLATNADNFLVANKKWVFFVKNDTLWRMRPDGKDPIARAQVPMITNLFVVGDRVYTHSSGAQTIQGLGIEDTDATTLP
ncbi:MAG: DUF5050 domain-containing protein [Oscillospiraceae bacterium]|jgi:hypothetical protein|nr:DUF5050 domain-containing protein [Oscillospiraceae bacterium]